MMSGWQEIPGTRKLITAVVPISGDGEAQEVANFVYPQTGQVLTEIPIERYSKIDHLAGKRVRGLHVVRPGRGYFEPLAQRDTMTMLER